MFKKIKHKLKLIIRHDSILIEQKFEQANKQFNELKEQLDEVKEQLDKVKGQLDKTTVQLEQVKEQNRTLDMCINTVYNHVTTISHNLDYYYDNSKSKVNFEYVSSLITDNSDKKFLFVGFYGAYNCGDELMLQTLLSYIPKEIYKQVTVLLSPGEYYGNLTLPPVNFLHYPQSSLDYEFLAKEFDLLIWSGGAIIEDTHYYFKRTHLLSNMFIDLSNRFIIHGKKVVGIGLSTSKSLSDEQYIENLISVTKNFSYLSLRDKYSANLLSSLGVTNFVCSQDIVFANKYFNEIKKLQSNNTVKTIGIVFVCNQNTKSAFQKLISDISSLYSKECKIKCIPFFGQNNNDITFYKEWISEIKPQNHIEICKYNNSFDEVCKEIESCDILINMRYHAMVLCQMLGKPSFNICYDLSSHYYNKVRYIMELFDTTENMISYSDFMNNRLDSLGALKLPCDKNQELHKTVAHEIEILFEKYLR